MLLDYTIRLPEDPVRTADRLGIADAAYLYGAAVDILGNNTVAGGDDETLARATATMTQALTSDAQLRLFLAGPTGPSQPMGSGGASGCAEAVRAYFAAYGYVGTQHPVSNVRVAFTGADTATGTSQIPCFHWLADGRMLLAPVRYLDEFRRVEGIWKISKRDVLAMRFWIAKGYEPDPLDPGMARPI
jgi:hypothetical protein